MGNCIHALVPTHTRYSVILSMRIHSTYWVIRRFQRLFPDFAEYRT